VAEAGVSKPKVEVQSEPVLDAELEKQKAKAEEIAKKEEAKKEEVKEEVKSVDTGEALEETGLSLKIRNRIVEAGFNSLEKIANAKLEDLMEVDGVGQVTAERIQAQAQAKLKK
jgi:transcription termination factor NusA